LLGGVREDGRYESDEALEQARSNLRKFDICGVIEDSDGIVRQLENTCRLKIKIGVKNKSPVRKSEQSKVVTDKIRQRIERMLVRDIALYEEAKRISQERLGEWSQSP